MTDDEEYRPRLTALELAHEKLDGKLDEQHRHSRDLDRKAARTLQASLAFSGVASAATYYLAREAPGATSTSLDSPITYAAISFGLVSVVLCLLAIRHTGVETEIRPANLRDGTRYGRKELLLTLVQTYPEYVRRNDRRIETDIRVLSGAQVSLVLAIVCTVLAIGSYASGYSTPVSNSIATFLGGLVVGATTAVVLLSRHANDRKQV